MKPAVVVLVDDRKRDLPLAALIAHQLDALGVACHLEPLEAYRAVLAAYRPAMIVFNHLNASHLVAYSRRLTRMGVLTAVLPNEGIVYNEEQMRYISNRHHHGAHIDYFYCWNEPHRDALREAGFGKRSRLEVVGVPRFDFYFEPWSRIYRGAARRGRSRPQVLLCTNFQIAKFYELPRAQADKFFSAWSKLITLYRVFWGAVVAYYRASQGVLV